jgi:hypothetical protein
MIGATRLPQIDRWRPGLGGLRGWTQNTLAVVAWPENQKPVSRKSMAARMDCRSAARVPAWGPSSARAIPASCGIINRYRSSLKVTSGVR